MEIDFANSEEIQQWQPLNDGIMGGLSHSGLSVGETEPALWHGVLSLDNNGGFASIRRRIPNQSLAGQIGVAVKLRGDGRVYQFRVRMENSLDSTAYRCLFATDGRQQIMRLPFQDFQASYRGQLIAGAPPLDPEKICQLGFLLADKRAGAFGLELGFIHSVS